MSKLKVMNPCEKKRIIYAVFAVKTLHKSLQFTNGCTADDVIEYVRVVRSKQKPTTKEQLIKGMNSALESAVKLGLIHVINGRYIPGIQIKQESSTIGGDPLYHIEQWLLNESYEFDLDDWVHVNETACPEISKQPSLPALETLHGVEGNVEKYVQQWLEESDDQHSVDIPSEMMNEAVLEVGSDDITGSEFGDREKTFSDLWIAQHFGKNAIYTEDDDISAEELMTPEKRRYVNGVEQGVKRKRSQEGTDVSRPSCVKKKVTQQKCKLNIKKYDKPVMMTNKITKRQLKNRVDRDKSLSVKQTAHYKSIIDNYMPQITDSNTLLRVQSRYLSLKSEQLRTKYEKPKTKENDNFMKNLNEEIKSASAMLFLLRKLNEK